MFQTCHWKAFIFIFKHFLTDSEHPTFSLLRSKILSGNAIVWELLAQEKAVIGSMWGYQQVTHVPTTKLQYHHRANQYQYIPGCYGNLYMLLS